MGDEIRYYRRFHGYDYAKGASLFITMATDPRASVFGCVRDARVVRSEFGEKVFESLEAIPSFNPGLRLYEHELMPDHLHCNLYLPPCPELVEKFGLEAANRAQLQRLGAAMRRFKTFTTTLARRQLGRAKLWQQGYHDRICVSRRFIDAVTRYIRYNALKYELMYNQPEFMRVREPLDFPRFDADDFWKGMGNVALLAEGNKILSLRVSRKTRDIGRLVARTEDAVRAGYTILSGFISPGEQAVRDMLLANGNATFIHVLPSCMKNGHRPDSRYLKPLQEGRFLEIGEGNDESEFGRAACLALNDEIVKIACAGEGVGVYWREERAWRITPDGAGESGQRGAGAHGAGESGQRGAGAHGAGESGQRGAGAHGAGAHGVSCDVKSRGLGPA